MTSMENCFSSPLLGGDPEVFSWNVEHLHAPQQLLTITKKKKKKSFPMMFYADILCKIVFFMKVFVGFSRRHEGGHFNCPSHVMFNRCSTNNF